MTEKEFRELFGNHDEHYIQIKDLREILIKPSEILVFDFINEHRNEIWEDKNKTEGTARRALRQTFGSDWAETLTFPDLIKGFRKLHYIKGVGKKTLSGIIKACELSGHKIPATYIL